MKTKSQIVQRLLEEKHIDAEEAVILLMGENKEIQYIPYPQPVYPQWPYSIPLPSTPIYNPFPTIS